MSTRSLTGSTTYNPLTTTGSTTMYLHTTLLFPPPSHSSPTKSPQKTPIKHSSQTPPRSTQYTPTATSTSSFLPTTPTTGGDGEVDKIHGSTLRVPLFAPTRYTQSLPGVTYDSYLLPSDYDMAEKPNQTTTMSLGDHIHNPANNVSPSDVGWCRVKVLFSSTSPTADDGTVTSVMIVAEIDSSSGGSTVLAHPFATKRIVVTRTLPNHTGTSTPLSLPVNPPSAVTDLEDLTTLVHLHAPSLISSLSYRFSSGLVYTLAGVGITISVNPCESLEGVYGEEVVEGYWKGGWVSPHVYKVGSEVCERVAGGGGDQSVLVSGESGSGKTVATRYLLRYFSVVAGVGEGGVQGRIVSCNPILESFGNARTLRNPNSSRFGKFISVGFGVGGGELKMREGVVSTYLLEKCRILGQSLGERNYHVFYGVIKERKRWGKFFTGGVKGWEILGGGGDVEKDEFTDFAVLEEAFETMGFEKDVVEGIVRVVCAVLHLGNIEVEEKEEGCGLVKDECCVHVCELLGVDFATLENALCTKIIVTQGERFVKKLTRGQAGKGRDAIVKGLYGGLFTDVVFRINGFINGSQNGTQDSSEERGNISILDIFGFETFQTNSLEQLCINYCNEVLQSQFNSFVFSNEQRIYTEEGIKWSHVEWSDNQDAITLISGKYGVLDLLDEQVTLGKTDDRVFVGLVYDKCGPREAVFGASNKNRANGEFQVNHYAGWVTYDCNDFLEKNKDELPRESADMLLGSVIDVIRTIGERVRCYQIDKKGKSKTSIKNVSTTSQFTTQLKELVTRINLTQPHYIRCLKPNDSLTPALFDTGMIGDQLRCGGVLEAVRVSRLGYPHRYDHADFHFRYALTTASPLKACKRMKDSCYHVVRGVMDCNVVSRIVLHKDSSSDGAEDETKLTLDDLSALYGMQVGRTKVFLQRSAYEELEQERTKQLGIAAITLQKTVRGYVAYRSYRKTLWMLLKVQCRWRQSLARARMRLLLTHRAAGMVQTGYRRHAAESFYAKQRLVIRFVQRMVRGRNGRLVFLGLLHTSKAVIVQKTYRAYVNRKRWGGIVASVRVLQYAERCRRARVVVRQLKDDARDLCKVAGERDMLKAERDHMKAELEEAKKALTVAPLSPAVDGALNSSLAEKDRELAELRAEMEKMRNAPVVVAAAPAAASVVPSPVPVVALSSSALQVPDLWEEAAELRKKNEELERQLRALMAGSPLPPPPLERSASAVVREELSKYFNSALLTSGQTPLHVAAASNDENAIRLMLSEQVPAKLLNSAPAPIDVNDTNRDGRTVLHLATMNHNESLLRLLIANNAVLNAQDRNGDTALHLSHEATLVKILLGCGANPNIPNVQGFCPLHDVVKRQDVESANLLLAAGADVNSACDLHWCSPLHFCARTGQLAMLTLLCKTEFSEVMEGSSVKAASSHADLNAKDREGNTPLHHLVSTSHGELVDLLWLMLQHGADPNAQNSRGLSPLHLLCQNTGARRKTMGCEMLKLLLEHSGDPNITGTDGCTPIHLALYHMARGSEDHEHHEFALLLMGAGASLTPAWRFPKRWTKWWDEDGSENRDSGSNVNAIDLVLPLDIVKDDTVTLHKLMKAIVRPQGWVPNTRKACMQCGGAFGTLHRRHHCRHCGRICCSACSHGKLAVAYFPPLFADAMSGDGATRVCYVCEDILVHRRGERGGQERNDIRPVAGSDSTFNTFETGNSGNGFEEEAFYQGAGDGERREVNVGIIFDQSPVRLVGKGAGDGERLSS